jgi:hypothetical protein
MLNLGREVAARVPEDQPGWTAWLLVRPIMNRHETWDSVRARWTASRSAAHAHQPPTAFMLRYTRLSDVHLEAEARGDLDIAMREHPVDDWVVIAPDLDVADRVIAALLPDPDALHLPSAVEYPEPPRAFARERDVRDVLGAG